MESSGTQPTSLLVRRRWWVGMALAVCVGLVQVAPEFLGSERFASIGLSFLLWVLETPLQVLALSAIFAYGSKRRTDTMRLLVGCLLVAIAIGMIFGVAFVSIFEGTLELELDEKGPLPLWVAAGFGGVTGVFIAGVWGLAFVAPHLSEQARLRRLETEQLRLETEQLRVASELTRLRSQLEPHFLLNTLNTIAGLTTKNPREARHLLGCLGDLLRDALEQESGLRTLDQEVTWLQRYAELLESRHGDALHFEWDVTPDANGVLLPTLLLQPLLENAVQHGALSRAGGGRVIVHAELRDANAVGALSMLICTVTDNGPGITANEPRAGALGLHTVRRRLELECPGSILRLHSSSEGTTAIVEIPLAAEVAA